VYQKALRAKVEDIFTSCLALSSTVTAPLYHTPTPSVTLPVTLPTTHHPPGCGLLIYIADCEPLLRFQLHWTTPHFWRAYILRDSWAWNNRRKLYSKHLPPPPPSASPATPEYLPPHCSPSFPAPPCIKYFRRPSSLLAFSFPSLLVVSFVLFGCFGFLCTRARGHLSTCQKVSPSLRGIFFFVFLSWP